MKLLSPFCVIILLSLAGCLHFSATDEFYVSVTMRNQSETTITGVAIGPEKSCSRFGLLGSKGAGATAVVPVCFTSDFLIQWEEGPNDEKHQATVDIKGLVGSNYITLTYQGNGVWVAKKDESPPQATTNATSNVSTNK